MPVDGTESGKQPVPESPCVLGSDGQCPSCGNPLNFKDGDIEVSRSFVCKGCGDIVEVKKGKIRYAVGEHDYVRWRSSRY